MQDSEATFDQSGGEGAEAAQPADIAPIEQLSEPILSLLFTYWNEKRGRRRYPDRRDIDPVDIPLLLPSVFLI